MKLLIITPRFPYPIEKGDKLRIFNQIKFLSKLHRITLISISHQDISIAHRKKLEKYCDSIHIILLRPWEIVYQVLRGLSTGLPLQVSYFYSSRLKQTIHDLILTENPDHIYCQLIRVAEYVRNLPFPKTIDFMDCFSLSTRRRAIKTSWWLKWFFYWESKKVAQYEKNVFFDFEHHFVISQHDKEAFQFHSKSLIQVIPNGLDHQKFMELPDISPQFDLVFVGNMGYYPNIQAALFLVKEILPYLDNNTTVLIAGARPDRRVRNLVSDRVRVTGWIPDIRKAYQSGRIFIAPLFEGAGLQNKVLEAMSLGVPCVISPIVNNAIQAEEGTHVLIANDAATFAQHVTELLNNNELRVQLIKQGQKFVQNQYNWDLFNSRINNTIISEYDAFNRKRAKDYA